MFFGDGAKGHKFANTCVGENDIDPAFHLSDGRVKAIKVSEFGNISLNARNVAADGLDGFVELLLAAAGDEDVGALFDEKFCGSQPNSFGATGDDCGLAFEFFGHCPSLAP